MTKLRKAFVPRLERTFPDWDVKPTLIAQHRRRRFQHVCRRGTECCEFAPDRDELYGR